MTQKHSLPNHITTQKVISLFKETCEKVDLNDPPDPKNPDEISGASHRVQPAIDKFGTDVCSLVVIGEIKKGKTSLINALLGLGDLLPISDNVATSTVFKLVYGGKRRNVAMMRQAKEAFTEEEATSISAEEMASFFDESMTAGFTLYEKEIADEDLYAFGTEDGNPGNEKGVDHIRIEIPSTVLKQGLEIIDTPGLGGMIKEHAEIAWQYIPQSHAVLFVLESIQSPFTSEEQQFLEKLKTITSLIFFAQTKIDVSAQGQCDSWEKRNLEEIAKVIGVPEADIPYFQVSSKYKIRFLEDDNPKFYDRSGFMKLEAYVFDHLIAAFNRQKCFDVIESIQFEASTALSRIEKTIEIAQTENEEKLSDLEKEYSRKKEAFTKFETEEFPDMIKVFQDELGELIDNGERELSDFLQPTTYNPIVNEFISGVRNLSEKPRKIKFKIDELCSYFADTCGDEATRIYERYKSDINDLVFDSFIRIYDRIEELEISDPKETEYEMSASKDLIVREEAGKLLPSIIYKNNNLRFSRWEETRNAFFGSTAGGSMGFTAGMALATGAAIVFPPAAPFTPLIVQSSAALGTLLGGLFSSKHTKQAMRDKIISHLEQALPSIFMQMQRQFSRKYKDEMKAVQRKVRDEKMRILRTMRKDISDRLSDISRRRTSTGKDGAEEIRQLLIEKNQLAKLNMACFQAVGRPEKAEGHM